MATSRAVATGVAGIILLLILPILIARLLLDPGSPSGVGPGSSLGCGGEPFRLFQIPISQVLTRALSSAGTTRSQGMLTHALLELQNLELTVFAGLGYGVHLRDVARGASMEAFPGGKLPRCGKGGRYDEWGKVRGLRYAYQRIVTTGEGLVTGGGGGDDGGLDLGDKLESLLMGWPALLLERAGVMDPKNPVPPGSQRNVYGEAVDRIVDILLGKDSHTKARLDQGKSSMDGGREKDDAEQEKGTEDLANYEGYGSILLQDSFHDLSPLDPKLSFILPQFLSIYAVARQNEKWLIQAVVHLEAYNDVSSARNGGKRGLEPSRTNLLSEQLNDNAWLLAGAIRVLSTLERWVPEYEHNAEDKLGRYRRWRGKASADLKKVANDILLELRTNQSKNMGVPIAYLGVSGHELSPGDIAGISLTVGSVYRLAQLGWLGDSELLRWADHLYNTVANQLGDDGSLVAVPVDDRGSDARMSEAQSMVIMMWAGRRDCVKAGVCQKYEALQGWRALIWRQRRQ